jgi:hypothetical protein
MQINNNRSTAAANVGSKRLRVFKKERKKTGLRAFSYQSVWRPPTLLVSSSGAM